MLGVRTGSKELGRVRSVLRRSCHMLLSLATTRAVFWLLGDAEPLYLDVHSTGPARRFA